MNLIEQILRGQAAGASSAIAKMLNKKLTEALLEQRAEVAAKTYSATESEMLEDGGVFEDEMPLGNAPAAIQNRMRFLSAQIKATGDPGGMRGIAVKRLRDQLRRARGL